MIQFRNRHLLALDALLLAVTGALSFVAYHETTDMAPTLRSVVLVYLSLALPLRLAGLWYMGLYRRLWRYAGQADIELLAVASAASALVGIAVGGLLLPFAAGRGWRVPIGVLSLDALLGALALAVPRVAMRRRPRRGWRKADDGFKRVLIAGAGEAGAVMVREMRAHQQIGAVAVAFVDDDPAKQNRWLHGVPIVGTLADIPEVVRRLTVDEVIVAMPAAPGAAIRRVLRATAEVGVATRTVPGLYELLSGRKSVSTLRGIEIQDLLRRDPVSTDLAQVRELAAGKVVLVTGAGGSIGSELCNQLSRLGPSRLIVVGRGENSVFELMEELRRNFPKLLVEPVIADVRDSQRLERVFRAHRPSTVFHAAAHKHVPLMEQNVAEALLNNVLGTQVVGELAARFGAERFVLISSDKAVRPSSVMGATKRLAEGVIQALAEQSDCRFISVRFGNVLGSRGSVIPTFLRQIRAGGPVTVTHPEMLRYFMTIPEAVQLVLQAGVMGEGGEVFVLDMGEPVRVVDLARDLIRLSGLGEDDIEIRYTGMRPGEKLYEELFFNEENAAPTDHPEGVAGAERAVRRPRSAADRRAAEHRPARRRPRRAAPHDQAARPRVHRASGRPIADPGAGARQPAGDGRGAVAQRCRGRSAAWRDRARGGLAGGALARGTRAGRSRARLARVLRGLGARPRTDPACPAGCRPVRRVRLRPAGPARLPGRS
jgi:FlaA1/EpsC-like NDP-sugar epimerase